MRTATSSLDRQQAREYLQDALTALEAFERGEEPPEHAWALPECARTWAECAARVLSVRPVPSLEMVKES